MKPGGQDRPASLLYNPAQLFFWGAEFSKACAQAGGSLIGASGKAEPEHPFPERRLVICPVPPADSRG
jgi:hypothetical protein